MQLHAANLDVHSCRRCVVCLSGERQSAATLNSGKPKAAGFGERPPESRKGAAGGRKQKGKVDPRRQDFERVANYVRKAPPTEAEDYLTANLSAGLRYLLERPMPDSNDTPWSHLSTDDVIYTQDSDPGQGGSRFAGQEQGEGGEEDGDAEGRVTELTSGAGGVWEMVGAAGNEVGAGASAWSRVHADPHGGTQGGRGQGVPPPPSPRLEQFKRSDAGSQAAKDESLLYTQLDELLEGVAPEAAPSLRGLLEQAAQRALGGPDTLEGAEGTQVNQADQEEGLGGEEQGPASPLQQAGEEEAKPPAQPTVAQAVASLKVVEEVVEQTGQVPKAAEAAFTFGSAPPDLAQQPYAAFGAHSLAQGWQAAASDEELGLGLDPSTRQDKEGEAAQGAAEELAAWQAGRAERESQLQAALTRCSALEAQLHGVASMGAQLTEIETQLQTARYQVQVLRDRTHSLEAEHVSTAAALAFAQQDVALLRDELQQARREQDALQEEVTAVLAEKLAAMQSASAAAQEVADLTSQLQQLQQQWDTQQQQQQQLLQERQRGGAGDDTSVSANGSGGGGGGGGIGRQVVLQLAAQANQLMSQVLLSPTLAAEEKSAMGATVSQLLASLLQPS
ncbi:hypothetical protein V8C86DRAFT_3029452 [Haematococcus lacustris]